MEIDSQYFRIFYKIRSQRSKPHPTLAGIRRSVLRYDEEELGKLRMTAEEDGCAGDANHGVIGRTYTSYRQPEPTIAAIINRALGSTQTVVNVGAGLLV